jgi:hypothetical protein
LGRLVARMRRPTQMQELLRTGDCNVEQAALVLDPAPVADGVVERCVGDQVPGGAAAGDAGRKAVSHELRDEYDRPLQPLGLMYGHNSDRIGANEIVVLPPFRVGAFGMVTQEAGEAFVLFDRV